MLNILLFGPPGSGKGTQAARLIDTYNLYHISSGDLLREERRNGTELGKLAQSYMDAGAFVPDEVVIGMISHKLDEKMAHINGVIFDGFPRTVAQAVALDAMLASKGTEIKKVLSLHVTEEEVVKRILERGKTSQRTDDTEEVVRKRYLDYIEKTTPVAEHYNQQGKLVTIEGEGSMSDINAALCVEIDKIV
jgi:adenylate kinase